MQLDNTILDDFKKITGKDISAYFLAANTFFSGDYNTLVEYYSGFSQTITSSPFANLTTLKQLNKDIMEAFKEHSRQFSNLKWFLLIEQIEQIDSLIATTANINKWARSSLSNVAYDPSIQLDYVIKQNQTIESVAAAIEGSNNPNDDWADIALKNNLREEDYTPEGGVDLKLVFAKANSGFSISSVVDVIQGKSIYGRDIYRKIQWTVDNNGNLNLTTLSNDDTITQAVNILATLKKGDNPDNPDNGIQSNLVVGSNRNLFNFPVISRQINKVFAGDDTLKNFNITNLSRDSDNIKMEFVVQTRIDEIFSDTVPL